MLDLRDALRDLQDGHESLRRVDAATQWCAREQAAIDADPVLRWARDEHLGSPLPAGARTPVDVLEAAPAHCEASYGRTLTRWG